jgi:Fe2+ transport system protein B
MTTEQMTSKDQMVFETHILLTTLRERFDKHSLEHYEMFKNIHSEIKQLRSLFSEEIEEEKKARIDLDRRLIKLEAEKYIGIKIMVPIFSLILGVIGSTVGAFITKMIDKM